MLNNIFISDAFAQAADAAATVPTPENSMTSFVPLILIFAIFYFLIIRPQSKKYKDHQMMVNDLKAGAKIVTTGGIFGTVKEVNKEENLFEVEIAQGVVVKIQKQNVATLVDAKKPEDKKSKNK